MLKIKPFSDNVIFYDSEFTSLDPYKGEIVSIGLIKPNGKELYLEIEHNPGTADPWVKKNILPTLKGELVSREKARRKIRKFIGKSQPFLISYVNDYDMIYWYKLFGKKTGKNDKNKKEEDLIKWLPIDFASLLFFCGFAPESSLRQQEKFLEMNLRHRVCHNAIEDARLLRDIYYKFIEKANEK